MRPATLLLVLAGCTEPNASYAIRSVPEDLAQPAGFDLGEPAPDLSLERDRDLGLAEDLEPPADLASATPDLSCGLLGGWCCGGDPRHVGGSCYQGQCAGAPYNVPLEGHCI